MRRRTLLALVLAGGFGACRKKKPRGAAAPQAPAVPRTWSESGIASWYGVPYHGRRAANGEIYDMEKLTAAHRTLPFNTMVRVTSLTNGKSVTVRITDRGPFIDGRIIDLSKAAAREIDMIGPGLMKVRVETIGWAEPQPSPTGEVRFGVQVGAFLDRRRAERLQKELSRNYEPVRLVARDGTSSQWRVIVGEKPSELEAFELASEIKAARPDAFVVRLDGAAGR